MSEESEAKAAEDVDIGADPEIVEDLDTLSRENDFIKQTVERQRDRTVKRGTMNQWLDENENEWSILDSVCRSRPWATNKETPFPYPFKESTKSMRQVDERPWAGDTEESLAEESHPSTRSAAAHVDVLTNILPCSEYPPAQRMLLFTPEFGSSASYAVEAWVELKPRGKVDIWTVCWQGWAHFDDMIREVARWAETFADGVSTVWFGHSAGAIVMYECLKRLRPGQAPCLPVAAFVSGCPAPHLFAEAYDPVKAHPWLGRLRIPYDFERLEDSQTEALRRDFAIPVEHIVEEDLQRQLEFGIGPPQLKAKLPSMPKLGPHQRPAVLGDLKLLKTYSYGHGTGAARQVPIPLIAFRSEEDELVLEEAVDAWAGYTAETFEVVDLSEQEDVDLEYLAALGHGFARVPPKAMLRKVQEVALANQINKDVSDVKMLPDMGPTDDPLPTEVDVVIVGAGITGAMAAKSFTQRNMSVLVLERREAVGGIWRYYGNVYSRVNTSEVGYRVYNQEGPTARPNQDHSPTHDIMRDIYSLYRDYAYGCVRCCWEVLKTRRQADDSYIVEVRSMKGQTREAERRQISCKFVLFAVNRRIGRRREVTFPQEKAFRGDICYGYANDMKHLNFWGKRVIVVGAGAFAYENLRTALEHGARHVTILGRRAGTTCPKWIDLIAFLRPTDENWNTHPAGNTISFGAWRTCYEDAGLAVPECWKEGLLKPHNHTVSVSDLAFIAGFHGMCDLKVGEIDSFHSDGHRAILKSGETLEVDIVIKCTGFLMNDEVPKITGKDTMHANGLLDFNMAYIAEPLLDGGQFGSARGSVDDSHIRKEGFDDEYLTKSHERKFRYLPKNVQDQLIPKGNPFGSGYTGALESTALYVAWLATVPDRQRRMLGILPKPQMPVVQHWNSLIHKSKTEDLKEMLARAYRSISLD